MQTDSHLKVGYVVKRYPRYSETFIVNEILAHEAAGLDVQIFALLPPCDTHFQDIISRVKAPVTYLPKVVKAEMLWSAMRGAAAQFPNAWQALEASDGATARDVAQAAVLAREIESRGIHHLHAHFATSATTVARLAARMSGITYSFTAHAKDIFHEDTDFDALRNKYRDAANVITVSDYNVKYLRELTGDRSDKLQRIYNGLDLHEFQYHSPQQRQPTILAVGRLVEKKGFSVLIEACQLLRQRGCIFQCDIIGEGELKQTLQEQIISSGLVDQVRLGGPRPQRQVIQALSEAAVFAAPCVVGDDGNRDGLPTVLLESMALGTPCISTDVTGIPEILHHETTGLLVEQGNAVQLADALARMLESGQLRVDLAEAARRLIESEFNVHQNAIHQRTLFRKRQAERLVRVGEVA